MRNKRLVRIGGAALPRHSGTAGQHGGTASRAARRHERHARHGRRTRRVRGAYLAARGSGTLSNVVGVDSQVIRVTGQYVAKARPTTDDTGTVDSMTLWLVR